jgi:hypothetical protein
MYPGAVCRRRKIVENSAEGVDGVEHVEATEEPKKKTGGDKMVLARALFENGNSRVQDGWAENP